MRRAEKPQKQPAVPVKPAGPTPVRPTPVQQEEHGYYAAAEKAGLQAFGLSPAPQGQPEEKDIDNGR